MEQIEINGKYRLTSEYGVIDTRVNHWYSEVIIKEEDVKYFVDSDENQKPIENV